MSPRRRILSKCTTRKKKTKENGKCENGCVKQGCQMKASTTESTTTIRTANTPKNDAARKLLECPSITSGCPAHCNNCCATCGLPSRAQRKAAARCAAYSANYYGSQQRRKQLSEAANIKSQNINHRLPGGSNYVGSKKSEQQRPAQEQTRQPDSSMSSVERLLSFLAEYEGTSNNDSPSLCTECLELALERVDFESCSVYPELRQFALNVKEALVEFNEQSDDEECNYETLSDSDSEYEPSSDEDAIELSAKENKFKVTEKHEGRLQSKGKVKHNRKVGITRRISPIVSGVPGRRKAKKLATFRSSGRGADNVINIEIFIEGSYSPIKSLDTKVKCLRETTCYVHERMELNNVDHQSSTILPRYHQFKALTYLEKLKYIANVLASLTPNCHRPSIECMHVALQLLSVFFEFDRRAGYPESSCSFNTFFQRVIIPLMPNVTLSDGDFGFLKQFVVSLIDLVGKVHDSFKFLSRDGGMLKEFIFLRKLITLTYVCGHDVSWIQAKLKENDPCVEYYQDILKILETRLRLYVQSVGSKHFPIGCSYHGYGVSKPDGLGEKLEV